MPGKIGFIVVNSSSHEENYSADELKVHAPTARGWRSRRLCSYPQNVTLQLEERSRVRKLQLLAHQYMIPSRVEFHIGDSVPGSSPLRRLGYVSLSDNHHTLFKARELKSVHMDAIGTHLRITLHQNHVNRHNRFSQVALVAINVLGESLDGTAFSTMPSREQLIEHYLCSGQQEAALDATYTGRCEWMSPLDDLAFDMYQDPEVAQLIRLLDQRKQEMVHQERFEQARHLKQALADLQKVGERLARLEVEKRCALEKEQYEQAEQKKQQMEQYRRTVYDQLEAHHLLQPADVSAAASEGSPCPLPSPDVSPVPPKPSVSTVPPNPSVSPVPPNPSVSPVPPNPSVSTGSDQRSRRRSPRPDQSPEATQSSSPRRPRAPNVPSVLPYDERPLPALERRAGPAEATASPPEELPLLRDASGSPGISGEPEPLSEKAQREAGDALHVFGETTVCAAYSKNFSYREDALEAVRQRLKETWSRGSREELRAMVRAAVLLLRRSLRDKICSVFQCSLKLLLFLLAELIPGAGLGRAEVALCVEQTWPHLLPRTGDACSRLRLAAIAFVQEMSLLREVRALHMIPCELARPIRPSLPVRQAQSQAELLERLLAALGTDASGFTLENVMTFCTGALVHSARQVRDAAVRIVLYVYRQHGAATLRYLPPPNHASRSHFIYKKIFDAFAEMDGPLADAHETGGPQERGHTLQDHLTDGSKSTKAKQAAKVKKVSQRTTRAGLLKADKAVIAPESVDNFLDNLCIFCGRKDEAFTEEGLDRHYWKHCPMLRLCDHCKQVVEICSVTEHLLGECERRGSFSQCPRCTEAVPSEELEAHADGPRCNPPSPGEASSHCPLCHSNFQPGEEAWKDHLMGREGCGHNPRRTVPHQTRPTQVDSSRTRQSWTVGPRGRAPGRGSRIPALAPAHRTTPGKR